VVFEIDNPNCRSFFLLVRKPRTSCAFRETRHLKGTLSLTTSFVSPSMSIPSSSPELGHHFDDETAPFLSREPSDPLAPSQPEDNDGQKSELSKSTRLRLLITLIVILLSFEIGGQMITGPMVRVIETIACDNYWRHHDPARLPATGHLPEHLCKIAPVQTEVATVKGYSDLLEGLLCSIFSL
jgi:hypothetical protein